MKVNLVGAGYWGSKVYNSLKKLDVDAEIIDIKNGQTILDIKNTNPVILATPLWQHYEQTIELLSRGHDVYVEKPMAETEEQLKHIARIVDNHILMVGHIFIHHPHVNFHLSFQSITFILHTCTCVICTTVYVITDDLFYMYFLSTCTWYWYWYRVQYCNFSVKYMYHVHM